MLEGPQFTARGESLKALEMTTIASFIGGVFSCLVLATVAPQLAHFALDFSAPEYFSLGIFGLTIVATLSEGALLKGCIAALLGMLNCCASGVTVVNIDNGFGAACAAARMIKHIR